MGFFVPTAAAGNGLSLATFGRAGEIMGFFYPRIDFAQNVREGMPALRLLDGSEAGQFVWCFQECWRVAQSFEPASNVLVTRLAHRELDLTIEISDVVPPEEHALFRRVVVSKGPEAARAQFQHYFRLAVGDVNTRNGVQAYPDQNLVVQHYRHIVIAVGATEPFAAQCGSCSDREESPTKRAMASGQLGSSLRAIGRVDFAIGFEPIDARRWETTMVLVGAPTQASAVSSVKRLIGVRYEDAVRSADKRVEAELADAGTCPIPELADAFDRAVISLHDLYDESEGTFIAAPEFDPGYELSGGYGYCWPRDAAVSALAMQRIGRLENTRRFFEWSARAQLADGHWYQRYWTDGSPAPSWCVHNDEIQLDQTCAVVHAAGLFARRLGPAGASFVDSYRPVALAATRAILDCLGEDGLHRPATDLWENSVGTFAYTQAGVIAALREADEVFGLDRERTGPAVRSTLRERLMQTFWQPDRGRWLRRISPEGQPDATLDSSPIGLIDPWGLLDLTDPEDRRLALATLEGISANLRSEVKAGSAILRVQSESYMGGGPGCVNTLWLALARLRVAITATDPQERREQGARSLADIRVALANTSPTGQLPELIPKISSEYWAAPHAWACSLLIEAGLALRRLDPEKATAFDAMRARVRRRAPSR